MARKCCRTHAFCHDTDGASALAVGPFEADLARYTAHRPSTLCWVLAPGATVGGIGAGLVRCVRPWHEWLIVWRYDVTAGAPDLTTGCAESVVRKLVDDDVPVTVTSSSAWTVNAAPVFEALDGLAPLTPEQLWATIEARKEATEAAEKQRARLREAIAFKTYRRYTGPTTRPRLRTRHRGAGRCRVNRPSCAAWTARRSAGTAPGARRRSRGRRC